MKTKVWLNGNKMLIETGHKTFDKQTNVISASAGATYAFTQYSCYIRAFNDTVCNNHVFDPGHLQNHDLASFDYGRPRLRESVRARVKELAVDSEVILYRFHHHSGEQRIDHGYVITTTDNQHLATYMVGPNYKSYGILDECKKYILDDKLPIAA